MWLKRDKKKEKKILVGVFLFYYLLKKYFKMRRGRKLQELEANFKDFVDKEGKEIKEYTQGKENLGEFIGDSGNLFKDYFIPYSGNNHTPFILRTKSLAVITILAVFLKFSLVAYLYFVFPHSGKADEAMVAKILALVNQERQTASLKPLTLNPVLSNSALTKANDMVEKDYFAHTSPDGRKPWDFIDRSRYAYSIVGENLAMNFTSAESAHKALVNSPSHKHNLLNDRYQDVGLAIVNGEIGGKTTNILVQMFSVKVALEPAKDVVPVAVAKPETPKAASPSPAKPAPASQPVQTVTPAKPAAPKIAEASTPASQKDPSVAKAQAVAASPPSAPLKTEKIEEKIIKAEPAVASKTDTPLESIETDLAGAEQKENDLDPAAVTEPVLMRTIKHPGDQVLAQNVSAQISEEQMLQAEREKTMPAVAMTVEHSQERNFMISESLIRLVQVIIASILSLLIISLLLNIFVRFEIQHKPVLLRTALVLVFVFALLFINFHYLEGGVSTIYMS